MIFLFNSILLGIGLAMDAFSVSVANSLRESDMKQNRKIGIASVYAFFQFLMPLLGWIFVHALLSAFQWFQPFIPWIALILLTYLGVKMIREADPSQSEQTNQRITSSELLLQGIATSIDALSTGFTISDYTFWYALGCAGIIGVVTFIISLSGLELGNIAQKRLTTKAPIVGGLILIFIGLEVFLSSFL